jgi:tetratricopeptide (TPR) repeat protein
MRRNPILPFLSVFLGELPPPPPRACFGRDAFIETVVGLAESLEPIALIGAGGIGKTSIALSVLHHTRIKTRFGDNRRFMRCNQFPASCSSFLARLSKVIGAGVKNPKDLTPLRPSLSSKEMLIILDNAESILDPQCAGAQEIYAIVNELCQFETICLCITSRITTVPPHCARPEIPTLSMEAACDIFYGTYRRGRRSDIVNNLLQRLDFHALSITLLATTASHNMWDYNRLAKEWDARRARVLRTDYNESLAATIELSLASQSFCKLGPDARDLLGIVAFFPQGIDEENLDWLFPTLSDRNDIDKFCVLSLTYRNNGFITMLAPIRDFLSPADPKSSSLLRATKDRYFTRLSVDIYPEMTGLGETRWIVSEDVNVEHVLDVFTSIDTNSRDVWDGCNHFMDHLYWNKRRQTVLRPKIEGLPDDHPSKPKCLFDLSRLFGAAGNHTERKKLLVHSLKLWGERGDDVQALALRHLSDANRWLGLHNEAALQAEEALEIYKRVGDTNGQSHCLYTLALSFFCRSDNELGAAEDAVSRTIDLVRGKGQEFLLCQSHHLLSFIYHYKGEKEKTLLHLETALEIASPFDWHNELFLIHYTLAALFCDRNDFDNANVHFEQAKSHVDNDTYRLGHVMWFRAKSLCLGGRRLKEAKSEVSRALEIYERLGAVGDAGICRELLLEIEQAMRTQSTSSLQ